MNQFSVDHPLSPNEDLESFDRAIGTKTRLPDRHGHNLNLVSPVSATHPPHPRETRLRGKILDFGGLSGPGAPGPQTERKNPGFWGSGLPRAAGERLKTGGGENPTFLRGFPGRPGPP